MYIRQAAKQAHLGRRKANWLFFWLPEEPGGSSCFLIRRAGRRKTKQRKFSSPPMLLTCIVRQTAGNEIQMPSSAQGLLRGRP